MGGSLFYGDGFVLEIRQEMIRVETRGHYELAPGWRVVDSGGHEHSSLDDLDWVVTGTGWCDVCQDEHEEGEYRCRVCAAVVEPVYVFVGPDVEMVQGLVDARLRLDDGRTFRLRGDELAVPWTAEGPSAEWIARVVSREPDEWSWPGWVVA